MQIIQISIVIILVVATQTANRMLDYLTLIVKPTNACNMRCKHCYHEDKGYDSKIMPLTLVEKLFNLVKDNVENLKIIWHGGEPLIVGLNYFRELFSLEKKILLNQSVKNSIQTNASLLTKEYINFFNENNVDIGVSFDGPYNDLLREKTLIVENKLKILHSKKSQYGILTVVTSQTINKLIEIYEYFKTNNNNFKFAYIFESGSAKHNKHLLIDDQIYVENVIKFFDYWIMDCDCNIHVDNFEKFINMSIFNGAGECEYSSCLFHFLSLDSNGNFYPCGRSYTEDYKLGHIDDFKKVENIFESENYKKLLIQSIKRREICKDTCDLFIFCQGGCNNNALMENGITNNNGFSCKTFRKIFKHVIYRLNQIKEHQIAITNPFLINLLNN